VRLGKIIYIERVFLRPIELCPSRMRTIDVASLALALELFAMAQPNVDFPLALQPFVSPNVLAVA
jgi:hypothetical protein